MASRELELVLKIKDEVSAGIRKVNSTLSSVEPQLKQMALFGTASFVAITGAIGMSVSKAMEAESAFNRLSHILKTSRGASQEQINVLKEQAEALENLGVVGADATMIAQGQLATFDLQASSIARLTPAILDYAVAEKGASVSTDELKALTNGLAQALQGNFTSLTKTGFVLDEATKELIKNGSEVERTTALVKVLDSTYKGFNASARNTAEGSLIVLRNSFNKLRETIGNAFLPTMTELNKRITPVIEKMTEWAEKHPKLISYIGSLGVAVTGIIGGLGLLGLAFLKIGTGLTAVIAGVKAIVFAFTSFLAVLSPVTIAIGALVVAMGYVSKKIYDEMVEPYNEQIRQNEEYASKLQELRARLDDLKRPIEANAEKMKEMAEATLEAGKKVDEVNKKITDLVKNYTQEQADLKQRLGDEFIRQEDKIARLQEEIREKTAERDKEIAKGSSIERLNQLNEEVNQKQLLLQTEESAYRNAREKIVGIDKEIAEARRIANLTEFERNLEQIRATMQANLDRFTAQHNLLQMELQEAKKQKEELMKLERQFTDDLKKQDEVRIENKRQAMNELAQLMRTMQQSEGNGILSPVGNPFGNFNFGGGGSVHDAIISPSGRIITTDPKDYLIATKNPHGLVGGGVNITINGDVTGQDLIDKVKRGIMKELSMDTKLAF